MTNVIALVPCHNEQETVAPTIAAILNQTRQADRVIVVDDRSTDDTATRAKAMGVEIHSIIANEHMKGGALNQALYSLLPTLSPDDVILVVDADSIIGSNFVERALEEFAKSHNLAGVSGSYLGKPGGGLLGWYQRNEFARWSFDDRQSKGKTVILSGAASAFQVWALREVDYARRIGALKGEGIYDINSFTEDFELSLAFLHMGRKIKKMLDVEVLTSFKDSWSGLFRQRLRWDRGISESLASYRVTRHTWPVVLRRSIYGLQIPLSILCLMFLFYNIIFGAGYSTNWFWITVAVVMSVEKIATVWSRGLRHAAISGMIIPEIPYETFLQFAFVRSLWDIAGKRQKNWR